MWSAVKTNKQTNKQTKSHKTKKMSLYLEGSSSQSFSFSSSHVWVWNLGHKESLMLKNWCFWTVVLEKTLESPLDFKEIQQVHPKGAQSWVFIGRTDVEVETPILWPLMQSADSFEKTLMLGKIEGRSRRGHRGWDGWMASPTQWTWVWVDSGSWWWTGRPDMLQFVGSQRVRHEKRLNWTEMRVCFPSPL